VIQFVLRVSLLVVFLTLSVTGYAESKTFPGTNVPPDRATRAELKRSKGGSEHYLTARSLAQAGLYQDAVHEVNLAISINPKGRSYYDLVGYCLESLRHYDAAIQAFNHALLLDRHDAYAQRELAICNNSKKITEKAADLLQPSIALTPTGERDDHWLGFSLKELERHGIRSKSRKETDFETNYWNGINSLRAGKFEEAAGSLAKAVDLKPQDFDANFWRGMSLIRARKFKEAIPNLEKAHEARQDDKAARLELFACYLITQQQEKAFRIFPVLLGILGGAFGFVYLVGLAILLPFSFRIRGADFPGLGFSLSWLALFFEGQFAFLLLLGLISSLTIPEDILAGIALAGVPIILVAAMAFARQPWGKPFTGPFRLGGKKILVLSLLLLLLGWLFNFGFVQLSEQITHQAMPLQRMIPLLRDALRSNPIIAFLAAGVFAPIAEEILFRGLIFGALQKWLQPGWVIFWTSLLFAFAHFEIVGLLPLIGLGALLGWVRFRTGSIGLPILLHASNNCLAMLALMLARN
jgi:membrane protease YdiL (CAAX protease family)/Flp pilus assembly protein TadD